MLSTSWAKLKWLLQTGILKSWRNSCRIQGCAAICFRRTSMDARRLSNNIARGIVAQSVLPKTQCLWCMVIGLIAFSFWFHSFLFGNTGMNSEGAANLSVIQPRTVHMYMYIWDNLGYVGIAYKLQLSSTYQVISRSVIAMVQIAQEHIGVRSVQ